jgi:hypothetical protein
VDFSREKWMSVLRSIRNNHSRRLRKFLAAMPYVLLAAGVVVTGLSAVRLVQIAGSQKSQIAAELWSGDSGITYRQITIIGRGQEQSDKSVPLCLTQELSLNVTEIEAIHKSLDTTIKETLGVKGESDGSSNKRTSSSDSASDSSDSSGDAASRVWIDAYSSDAIASITRPKSDLKSELTSSVELTGVGGDFYLFHPFHMLSGAFIDPDTLNSRQIVLDKDLSFSFFGTYESVGETVVLNGREYTVVGVCDTADTKIDNRSYGDLNRAYVLFTELPSTASSDSSGSNMGVPAAGNSGAGTASPGDAAKPAVMCYETVIPNRLRGIALQNIKTALESSGKQSKDFLLIENTDRFSPVSLYNTVFPIGETSVKRADYRVPYWELSAETAESVCVFWWIHLVAGTGTILTAGLSVYHANKKRISRV